MRTAKGWCGWVVVLLLVTTGCSDAATESATDTTDQVAAAATEEQSVEGPRQLQSFDPEFWLDQEYVGDLDGMAERGVVRALVVYSLGQYFLDGATQRGATYEALTEFEKYLNQRLGRKTIKVPVLIIPVPVSYTHLTLPTTPY